jgi:uncharacterized protein YaaW (UPF0174 family)
MITEKERKEGKYIYGIIRHKGSVNFGPIGMGNRNDEVYGISYREISAVVSNSPVIEYQARRKNLLTHERILEAIMERFTVLPLRFSTITENNSDESIIEILKKNYDKFLNTLIKLEDKKEVGLKVLIIEEKNFNNIIEKYDHIRAFREKLLKQPPEKTHYQRMEIGEMVAVALTQESENYKEIILDELRPLAVEVKQNDNFSDKMILNAAFLIEKAKEPGFDEAIAKLDKILGKYLIFKIVGTVPPYNFVNLNINIKEN